MQFTVTKIDNGTMTNTKLELARALQAILKKKRPDYRYKVHTHDEANHFEAYLSCSEYKDAKNIYRIIFSHNHITFDGYHPYLKLHDYAYEDPKSITKLLRRIATRHREFSNGTFKK